MDRDSMSEVPQEFGTMHQISKEQLERLAQHTAAHPQLTDFEPEDIVGRRVQEEVAFTVRAGRPPLTAQTVSKTKHIQKLSS